MIVVRLAGGMGNQMFQYALGRHLSLKNNVPLKLDTSILLDRTPRRGVKALFRNYELDVFSISASIATKEDIPFFSKLHFKGKLGLFLYELQIKFFSSPGKEKGKQFQPEVFSLGPQVYLVGYWQNARYFNSIADTIREDFTLKNALSKPCQDLFYEIKDISSVCVHVRRTDYVDNPYHGTLGQTYYDRGIEYIARRTVIKKIYVFSDDIEWCKENLRFPFETKFVDGECGEKRPEEQLVLMKLCKHFIIPNSTFSWWAAWLNTNPEKIVIAPKRWFLLEEGGEDIVPDTWIRL